MPLKIALIHCIWLYDKVKFKDKLPIFCEDFALDSTILRNALDFQAIFALAKPDETKKKAFRLPTTKFIMVFIDNENNLPAFKCVFKNLIKLCFRDIFLGGGNDCVTHNLCAYQFSRQTSKDPFIHSTCK